MEFKLGAMSAETIFEGEGGGYYAWSSSQNPSLAQNNVGAGRLVLHPRGFAFPHYDDSTKLCFVLRGTAGVAGLTLPNEKEEVVLRLKKGYVIPAPYGCISWWYNDGDSDLEILLLGDTSDGLVKGDISYFLLAGGLGALGGFSNEFVRKTYEMTEEEADKLVKTQTGTLIVVLPDGKYNIPKPHENADSNKIVFNLEAPGAGNGSVVTETEYPYLKKLGLSIVHEKVCENGVSSAVSTADPAAQLIYVTKGSGQFEVVGIFGKQEMKEEVKAGQLVVVPRLFMVGKIAGPEGLECCSIITSSKPVMHELKGKKSVWGTISPDVLEAAFDVSAEFIKFFRSKAGLI